MKKTVLLLLTTLMMTFIGVGCSEEHEAYFIRGDKLVCNKGCHAIKYSPRDIKDIPYFLYTEEGEAAKTDFLSWYGFCIWTGILEGKRYYAYNYAASSQIYGFYYTESGEHFQTNDLNNWKDVEVIYIHPKYIEYCNQNKKPIILRVPNY